MDYYQYEKKLKEYIFSASRRLSFYSDELAREIAKAIGNRSQWLGFKRTQDELMKTIIEIIDRYTGYTQKVIEKFIKSAIELAHEKNDELIKDTFKIAGTAIVSASILKLMQRQFQVGKAYVFDEARKLKMIEDVGVMYKKVVERKIGGLMLSDRVWNLSGNNKELIEHYLRNGFATDKSAPEIARTLKQYLRKPDKLFRRIRNDNGKLVLSKAAASYHPGQGVYRSSYQNALRLAATEINRAYRMVDHERMKANPGVVGFEVKLSSSHPARDICDHLKGQYPKSFLFTGWHPRCFCYTVPVLLTDDEHEQYIDSILNDKPYSNESANTVKDVPGEFKEWMNDNAERLDKMKSKPWFITENQTLLQQLNRKP